MSETSLTPSFDAAKRREQEELDAQETLRTEQGACIVCHVVKPCRCTAGAAMYEMTLGSCL